MDLRTTDLVLKKEVIISDQRLFECSGRSLTPFQRFTPPLVKIMMTTRVATAQSVKMSKRKCGSMGLCTGVSVEEGSELVTGGRADF